MKNLALMALILLMALNTTTELFAASQGFTVGATVTDNVPPSQPTGLSANAISSSRIDLSWTASTDDVAVTGYHIYRGGFVIATTSATSYSDTGLAASTNYSYNVAAIDAAGNESAQSAGANATTLAPSASQAGGSSGGGSTQLPIYGVVVTPQSKSLKVEWLTAVSAHGTLRWGKGADYELGSVSEVSNGTVHSIVITGLTPDTDYMLRIDETDINGLASVVQGIPARTLPAAESAELANVTNFKAVQSGNAAVLSWNNPAQDSFAEVRIVKSVAFFPVDPEDGEVVYEGRGEKFTDTEVKDGGTYYYAAFARDSAGNWTSGAVANIAFSLQGGPVQAENPLENLPSSPIVDPRIQSLTLGDFIFSQDGVKVTFAEAKELLIDGAKNLKVSIPYSRVPEILKTIAVTFVDPEDESKVFTFLLKVNADKTEYEAVIAPLEKGGEYGVRIAVVDYKNRGMKKIEGSLLATVAAFGNPDAQGTASENFYVALVIGFLKLLSLIALLSKLLNVALRAWRMPAFAKAAFQKS